MDDTLIVEVELWVRGYDGLESLVESLYEVASDAGAENARITMRPVLRLMDG